MIFSLKNVLKRSSFLILIFLIVSLVAKIEYHDREIIDEVLFSDYYGGNADENGGLEIMDNSFYTFEKKYTVPNDYMPLFQSPKENANKSFPTKDMYTIIKGDTLSGLSKKFGISMDTIRMNNPELKMLREGRKIWIVSEDGLFYNLKSGDNPAKIAKKYKVNEEDILTKDNEKSSFKAGEEVFVKNPNYKIVLANSTRPENSKITAVNKNVKVASTGSSKAVTKSKQSGKVNNTNTNTKVALPGKNNFGMPVNYAGVASKYGPRFHPVLKRYMLHTGVDLVAKYVPLKASETGVVSFAGRMNGYGKIIIVKHSNGYETRYAHLNKINVSVGQTVKKGQHIGQTGNTGRSTGPHLHFEIRHNGNTKNPMHFLVNR